MVDSEYLLFMAHNYTRDSDDNKPLAYPPTKPYVLDLQDRIRLYDAGIRTASEQPAWHTLEPKKGEYNFDYLDDIIKLNREAGLKSLVQIHGWRIPAWMPKEWRAQTKEGVYEGQMISMWNKEAQEYGDNYYRMLDDRYMDQPDVAFYFGEWQGGEGAMRNTHCYYDWAALEDYKKIYGSSAVPDLSTPETTQWLGDTIIEHFLQRGALLYPKYHEIWNMMQYIMTYEQTSKGSFGDKAFGNFVHTDIIKAYRESFPEACIVLCQGTYYDDSHGQDNVDFVDMLRYTHDCEVIVEAMYCRGLATTTPKAIAQEFRGQLVQPAFEEGATKLEDWMVDAIRVSHQLWVESKGDI